MRQSQALPSRVAIARQPARYDPALVRQSVAAVVRDLGNRLADFRAARRTRPAQAEFQSANPTPTVQRMGAVITHGTVIAAVAEQVAEALDGRGTDHHRDAPQTDSDFEKISGTRPSPGAACAAAERYPKLKLEILDLRREVWRTERGVIVERRKLPEDRAVTPSSILASAVFSTARRVQFYGADYDTKFTATHHSQGQTRIPACRAA